MKHLLLLTIGISITTRASAVILAGPNGTAGGNAAEPSLTSYITTNSLPSFPYWNNVVPVSDASGVYLGNGWVMTANHVTALTVNLSTITVSGTPYIVRQSQQVGTQDIRLYRIGGGLGDPALPALANIAVDASAPGLATGFLTFGRGNRAEGTLNLATSSDSQVSGSPANFEWAGASTMRWGANSVEALPVWTGDAPGPYSTLGATSVFSSTFDDPGSGNYLNANEAGHSVGDSGGPLFTVDAGVWVLSGISLAVGADPALGQPGSTTAFGNITVYADLATYKSSIDAITNIPEPSLAGLLGLGGLLGVMGRRKRGSNYTPGE